MTSAVPSKVLVTKVPPCGYLVIGHGTHSVGDVVVTSQVDPAEVAQLLKDGYIKGVSDQP